MDAGDSATNDGTAVRCWCSGYDLRLIEKVIGLFVGGSELRRWCLSAMMQCVDLVNHCTRRLKDMDAFYTTG